MKTLLEELKIRLAEPCEASFLCDLANRSKAYWPYESEYMDLVRGVTHVTAEDIQSWPFIVAVDGEKICGFIAVCEVKGERMLDHLWIDPDFIGKRLGITLFHEAVRAAQNLGWSQFTIASDPYAENFYLKLGAVRIGERESKVKKGFFLPLLQYKF